MPHLQIKNMDPRLYHALQKRAKKEHRPVSRQVIHVLSGYLQNSPSSSKSLTGELAIKPREKSRLHWEEAFQRMAQKGDDLLFDRENLAPTQWDKSEWKW